ncbi:MAG: shikimate kinase [Acidobacteriota bacterium]
MVRCRRPPSPHRVSSPAPGPPAVLDRVGQAVRDWRRTRQMSRRRLAEASGVSVRFLAQLEAGDGNISVRRLAAVAQALEVSVATLFEAPAVRTGHRIALVGLRGAGKSTIGPRVARRLGVPFVELDNLIESAAGLTVAQIFEIHGEPYFRRLERQVLRRFLDASSAAILATGGGLVTEPETYALLREGCTTIWLSATPEDHYNRVLAQGDRRPMSNNPHAMSELRALLQDREPLYQRADLALDTSTLSIDTTVSRIATHAAP